MWVSCQLDAEATLPQLKELSVLNREETGYALEPVLDTVDKVKMSCFCQKSNLHSRVVRPTA
jgi:hypothetical protein